MSVTKHINVEETEQIKYVRHGSLFHTSPKVVKRYDKMRKITTPTDGL